MTWPVTPDPGIHDDTKRVKQQSFFSEAQILTWAEQLPLAMIKDFADAILAALGLGGVVPTANNIITDVYNALLDIPQGNISGLVSSLEDIVITIVDALGGDSAGKDLKGLLAEAKSLLGGIESTVGNLPATLASLLTQNPLISTILALLGINSSGGSTSTGSTGTTTPTPPDTNLQQLLGLLGSGSPVPASLLAALAPTATKNLLADPGFNTGSGICGNGDWCWDGWIGTGAFGGVNSCLRTVRRGRITIYNMVGTSGGVYMFGGEPINTGGSGVILEYLRTNLDGFLGTAVDWALTGTDQNYFEWINVPYPASAYPMGPSVTAGFQWLVNAINAIPGPFVFVMDSQGNQVGAAVYDEIRFGSLSSRNNDFLGAIACGNLRREEGHYFPGCPDLAPGTSGMCSVSLMATGPYKGMGNPANPKIGNLIDTEDRWYDFAVPGDFFACTPIKGSTVVPPADAPGGNVGDIAGISGQTLRTFYNFVNFNNTSASVLTNWLHYVAKYGIFTGFDIIGDFLGQPYAQINNLGGPNSPHMAYYKDVRPLASLGDNRTFMEIGLDYLRSFVGGVHPDGTPITPPPLAGARHQYALQRFPVQPFQVVTAGASTMWINVFCPDDAIIVAVNAYDADGNLIATVTADDCVISNPPPSSNWTWTPLKADFVMPDGAVSACLVLDVEPEAMTTGIVWFDDLIFEVDTLIDGTMVNFLTASGIPGAAVAGPQGQADILTAWQNLVDQLASAHTQTSITGSQLSDMFQSVGQNVVNAQLAYQLGVAHEKILGNVAVQPYWSGMQPTGQVTFPLPAATIATSTISAGTAMMGYINTNPAIQVGFVEFLAEAADTVTGVYLNLYSMDPLTGDRTSLWSSPDISAQIPVGSLDWVPVSIPSDQPNLSLAQGVFWEIVSVNDNISVATSTRNIPNKTNVFPPNWGATRTVATTGGVSPATLDESVTAYGGTCPFVCMGVADLPPTYEPPAFMSFTSGAGQYVYQIPGWAQVSGATFDVVAIGGGGAGGAAIGSAGTSILGLTLTPASVKYGQGGLPGAWAPKTLTYATDIPAGTTTLTVINGAGGCAPSGTGCDTMIGYGFDTPPQFDAVGDGGPFHGTTLSWSHTAAAGAYVVVGITSGTTTFDVTYGGDSMTPLGWQYLESGQVGFMMLFGMPNAAAGTSTVTVTLPKSVYSTANSISFTGCSSAGPTTRTTGTGKALSQQVSCADNQTVVQAFGNYDAQMGNFAGGTNRFADTNKTGGNFFHGLSLSYTGADTTFSATSNVASRWGGLAVALQPAGTVLIRAAGGASGGPGGSANYNPNNLNTTATGKGAPDTSWSGRHYPGSSDTTTSHLPGNPWGGGSASGDLSNSAENGGDGATFITATQSTAESVSGGSGTGGSGTELPVIYEATGAGDENASGQPLTWTHTSAGGPNCGVVLLGAVAYNSGAATLTCTYGSLTFNLNLGGEQYVLAAGSNAFFMFAFGLLGIPGGTQTVSLGASGATIVALAGNTMSYQNVGAFGNFYGNHADTTSLSLTGIPSAAGQIVVCGFADVGKTISSFSQTERWNQPVTASLPMSIGDAPGAASVDFTASAGLNHWGAVGGVLLPQS